MTLDMLSKEVNCCRGLAGAIHAWVSQDNAVYSRRRKFQKIKESNKKYLSKIPTDLLNQLNSNANKVRRKRQAVNANDGPSVLQTYVRQWFGYLLARHPVPDWIRGQIIASAQSIAEQISREVFQWKQVSEEDVAGKKKELKIAFLNKLGILKPVQDKPKSND